MADASSESDFGLKDLKKGMNSAFDKGQAFLKDKMKENPNGIFSPLADTVEKLGDKLQEKAN